MYFYNFAFILSVLKIIAINQYTNFLGMVCILAGNKNNRFYIVEILFIAILTQYSLTMLMERKTVSDFHFLDIVLVIAGHVRTSHNNRNF